MSTEFDYTALDETTRMFVQSRTASIHTHIRTAGQRLIEIGRMLHEVKARLPTGHFGRWLDAEFGWDRSYSTRLMQLYTAFGDVDVDTTSVHTSALFFLSRKDVPADVQQQARNLIQNGQAVTVKVAERLMEKSNQPMPAHVHHVQRINEQRRALEAEIEDRHKQVLSAEQQLEGIRAAFQNLRAALIDAYGVPLAMPAPVRRAFSQLELAVAADVMESMSV